jgi:hypothetical protein
MVEIKSTDMDIFEMFAQEKYDSLTKTDKVGIGFTYKFQRCPECYEKLSETQIECFCTYDILLRKKVKKKKNKSKMGIIKSNIRERLMGGQYRGEHKSQHNRTSSIMTKVKKIMQAIELYGGDNNGRLMMPPGDDEKEKEEYNKCRDHENFYKMLEYLRQNLVAVKSNSLRKNIFVDLEKMGYIERCPKNKKPFKTVALTENGLQLANDEDMDSCYRSHQQALLKLIEKDYHDKVLNIMAETGHLDIDECMYFIDKIIPYEDSVRRISMYRKLSKPQRKNIDRYVKEEIKKINKLVNEKIKLDGNSNRYKNYQRDFSNWKNLAGQNFAILSMMNSFKRVRRGRLDLKDNVTVYNKGIKFERNQRQRKVYNEWHGCLDLKTGSTIAHHLYDFSNAKTEKEKERIDHHKNMLRLLPEEHNKLPTTDNPYVVLLAHDGNGQIIVGHIDDHSDTIVLNNCIYDNNNFLEMQKYNTMLIKKYGDRLREDIKQYA